GNDEREQTLNQLLVEMDGFEANEGIILVAATNRPDVLDPALLRPGRFDRQIVVPNPDVSGREKILRVHMRRVPLAPDVDAKVIARGTPGFSGADLANLVNEAALLAARRNKRLVTHNEFEDSKDKVMMGAERKSMAMTEEEKLATAYHEAGHAIVNVLVEGNDPLHKVTIIPRGRALGVTMSLPERDKLSYSKKWCNARLSMTFGGRVAEQIIYGKDHLNTGAASDITQATNIARSMVTEWGMSEKLGPLLYNENQQEVFLGHAITQRQNMSEETAKLIDEEVRRIVLQGEQQAWEILETNKDKLESVAQALMEFETISGEECMAVMRGEKINRKQDDSDNIGPVGSAVPSAGLARPSRDKNEDPKPESMNPQLT
ncbi:MAG: ATP-dependent zinc metalloprotease FtsH, partial [Hyphomicrobiaceae bacterium]|nr:ATP-dependent zinc metalloprotease FtsH [Hyphomicrobiaceae bacterium]